MPYGLQVFDSDGRTVMDTTSIVGILFGSINVGQGQLSGSVSNEKFQYGRPFAFPVIGLAEFTAWGAGGRSISTNQIQVSFSGNTLNWSRVTGSSYEAAAPAGVIYYGVYSNA